MTHDVLVERLQARVREYDRVVKRSLLPLGGYNAELAELRELLEAALQYIRGKGET